MAALADQMHLLQRLVAGSPAEAAAAAKALRALTLAPAVDVPPDASAPRSTTPSTAGEEGSGGAGADVGADTRRLSESGTSAVSACSTRSNRSAVAVHSKSLAVGGVLVGGVGVVLRMLGGGKRR